MEKKIVSGLLLTLLLLGTLTLALNIQPVKASGTIYIRADGSVDPPTANITSVDNVTYTFTSNNYDSIVVERDNIVVDGAGYTLQGTGSGNGIAVIREDLYVSNVTVKNTVIKAFNNGIYLYWASGNTLSGNNITANNDYGVHLLSSNNNTVSGNNITDNSRCIYLLDSLYNSVSGNNITNNNTYGIWLAYSNCSSVSGNNIANNGNDGIRLAHSNCSSVSGNNIANNKYGVSLWFSNYNGVSGNNITNNDYGVSLLASSNYNGVSGNNITNNDYGVRVVSSNCNIVSGNNITNNPFGVDLVSSESNIFYHNNFIANTQQVYIRESGYVNVWDDRYPSGGNYWSDYSGVDLYSGPDQDQLGSDGIGDTSYIIDNDNIDHYPLISPFLQTPDFEIVVSPSTGTTAQGTTVTTNVYVVTIAGYDYLVSLSASGQPEGVTIDFNPDAGTPYYTSTMTIQVGDAVPLNTYPITVTGLGADDTTHSTTYTLTVGEAVPEFPLGAEAATAIGLMVAVAYIWLRRRK